MCMYVRAHLDAYLACAYCLITYAYAYVYVRAYLDDVGAVDDEILGHLVGHNVARDDRMRRVAATHLMCNERAWHAVCMPCTCRGMQCTSVACGLYAVHVSCTCSVHAAACSAHAGCTHRLDRGHKGAV